MIKKPNHNLPLIIAFLLYLLFNTSLLFGVVMEGDGTLIFYPTEHALSEALKTGTLPIWTSKLQSGFSLVADGQPGSMYIPNILAFGMMPTYVAHNLIVLIHGMIGLYFTYKWAKLLNLSAISSAGAALIYALTSPLTSANVPHLETLAWTPAILYVTEKCVQNRSLKRLWFLSIFTGLQWTAGFPQIAFYTLVMIGIYMPVRLIGLESNIKERLKIFFGWSISILIGLLLASPQILLTQNLASSSIRDGGLQGSILGERSLLPVVLVTLFQPGWQPFFGSAGFGHSFYIGVLPFILAIVGVLGSRRWHWFWPLIIMSLVTLFLSWGKYNPTFSLINQLPGFSSFRVPSRFLEMTQLGALAFAAYGWDSLFLKMNRERSDTYNLDKWFTRFISWLIGLYVATVVIGYPSLIFTKDYVVSFGNQYALNNIVNDAFHLQSPEYYSNKIDQLYGSLLDSVNPFNLSVFVPFLILLVAWIVIRFYRREAFRLRWQNIWIGLVILDVAVAEGGMRSVQSSLYVLEMPKTAQIIHQDLLNHPDMKCRIYSFEDDNSISYSTENLGLLPPNYNSLWNLEHIGVYSPLGNAEYYYLVRELSAVNLAFGKNPVDIDVFYQNRPLLNFLNVCYVLSRRPLLDFEEIGRDHNIFVYYNDQVKPRVFLRAPADELESATPYEWTAPILESADATFLKYEPTHKEIEVHTEQEAIVVFTELTSNDWNVFVDGKKMNNTIPDSTFWNIPISTGSHIITLEYRPELLRVGLIAAIVGAIIIFVWWFMESKYVRVKSDRVILSWRNHRLESGGWGWSAAGLPKRPPAPARPQGIG